VIAIMGMVATLAAGAFPRLSSDAGIHDVTTDLLATLRQARDQAMSTGSERHFWLDVDRRLYGFLDQTSPQLIPLGVSVEMTSAEEESDDPSVGVISFLSDGSSTGGRLTLREGETFSIIDVDWLTGRASLVE
jgi:general secretion pathway protein H